MCHNVGSLGLPKDKYLKKVHLYGHRHGMRGITGPTIEKRSVSAGVKTREKGKKGAQSATVEMVEMPT